VLEIALADGEAFFMDEVETEWCCTGLEGSLKIGLFEI
jgi:hypothetical protein